MTIDTATFGFDCRKLFRSSRETVYLDGQLLRISLGGTIKDLGKE